MLQCFGFQRKSRDAVNVAINRIYICLRLIHISSDQWNPYVSTIICLTNRVRNTFKYTCTVITTLQANSPQTLQFTRISGKLCIKVFQINKQVYILQPVRFAMWDKETFRSDKSKSGSEGQKSKVTHRPRWMTFWADLQADT